MLGSQPSRPDFLERGEPARLIPVVADGSKEQRVTSALLAVLGAVDEFGREILQAVDAPASKTARIQCFTEVEFRPIAEQKHRPDGLIVVSLGTRVWKAIVEAKVGNAELDRSQIEAYLDIAKHFDVDAVITVSNQFAARSTHHPVELDKRKLGRVSLHHWSWTYLMSKAILVADHKGVQDRDQAYILRELIRYLQHSSSGVQSFADMGAAWKDLCAAIQQSKPIGRQDAIVTESVEAWHALSRFLALELSTAIGRSVGVYLTKAHQQSPEQRLQDDIAGLLQVSKLSAEFEVPDAASRIKLIGDLRGRNVDVSMRLQAPRDKARPSAQVTWILGQLAKCNDEELLIRASWPGRAANTGATLVELRSDRNRLIGPNTDMLITAFEICQSHDLGGRFRGPRTFVEETKALLPRFYETVGQNLRVWIPPAPKVKADTDAAEAGDGAIQPSGTAPNEPPSGVVIPPVEDGGGVEASGAPGNTSSPPNPASSDDIGSMAKV